MKKLLFVVICLGILFGASYQENNYTRKNCVVVQANDGWATIEDSSNHTWDYEDKNLKVGDIVNLKMHTNCSPSNINDDKIKKVIVQK